MYRLTDASLENPRFEFNGVRYDLKLNYVDAGYYETKETECCCDFFISDGPVISVADSTITGSETYMDFGHGRVPCEIKTEITKKTREMTLSEIEKELGYPVKIVKEETND